MLFGRPTVNSGLDETQCRPGCGMDETWWESDEWSDERIARLKEWTLIDPPPELMASPYADPPAPTPAGPVCAVVVVDPAAPSYRLATFASADAAAASMAIVTHHDSCGLCSTLADLAVYAREIDLTAPVRQCGIDTLGAGLEANVACLEELGFTYPCAQIWAYNTANTRVRCAEPCFRLLGAPYHEVSGVINECLRCDEELSGPVFKAIAGRTRRNTGLASALCRPCNEVQRIAHDYP